MRGELRAVSLPAGWGWLAKRWSSFFGAIGGEGDVPDVGAAADVEDSNDVAVGSALIAAKDDRLVGVDGCDALEGGAEFFEGKGFAVEDDGSVFADIEDDFADGAAGFFALFSDGDDDFELGFVASEIPGDEEEDEEEKDDVHHGSNLEAGGFGGCAEAEIHGLWMDWSFLEGW